MNSEYNHLYAKSMSFFPPLIAMAMQFLHHTCDFKVIGQEYEKEALTAGRSIIYTTWHFAFPGVVYYFRNRNGMLMVSKSRDGEWASRVLWRLGYQTVRGSTGKGGGAALRHIIAHIRAGNPGGFIADGSQGPALVAQKGIMLLARYTRAPLVPVSMAAHPCWRFRSWDRTLLVKPFSRVAIVFGPPIWVGERASHADIENGRQQLQKCLNELTRTADAALVI
ncbi:MAG: lysophospholipid acyltransferase family protein [Desulforhabdus sp.]|nr:lysophospholipid acyltransferase family protein [Desulforhabdus sp.]